jgi:hypothetical protein
MKITSETLENLNACKYQIRLFEKTFPNRVAEVTQENVNLALENDLDIGWLAQKIFNGSKLEQFKKLISSPSTEYAKAKHVISTKYFKDKNILEAEYFKGSIHTFWEYERVVSPAWEEYKKSLQLLDIEYKKTIAGLFLSLTKENI